MAEFSYSDLFFTIPYTPLILTSEERYIAVPAGLTPITDKSPPNAPIEPPIETKRAVPEGALSNRSEMLYMFCEAATNGNREKCRMIIENIQKDVDAEGIIDYSDIGRKAKFVLEILDEGLAPFKFILDILAIVMVLVVIMSMMGLLGMSIHYTNERRNEIAVRKIFGATEKGEVLKNLKFYLIITSVALVPAFCVTELMRSIFQQYSIYPKNIWLIYFIAAILSFTVSILSVFWQTRRAARTNPVEALKKE